MPYVYSTLTADTAYATYNKGGGDIPLQGETILIKGGANTADKSIVTPAGAVITEVTKDQLDKLMNNDVFQRHVERKFISFMDGKVDGEVAVAKEDMEARDDSAPITPNDIGPDEGARPQDSPRDSGDPSDSQPVPKKAGKKQGKK